MAPAHSSSSANHYQPARAPNGAAKPVFDGLRGALFFSIPEVEEKAFDTEYAEVTEKHLDFFGLSEACANVQKKVAQRMRHRDFVI